MLLLQEDTIVAPATAHGRAALAIVRISGPEALAVARKVCVRWPPINGLPFLTQVKDHRTGEEIDTVVVTRFLAPRSYTGEDTVEISCHGGPAVVAALLDAVIALGVRPANPGEFTLRAVVHGKLDLLQAEAVADLIDAPSQAARRAALCQLHGQLSRQIEQLRREVLEVEALIAYDLDFPDEDDGPIPHVRVTEAVDRAIGTLERMLATAPLGALLREGVRVVIAGVPNAGKSSLYNALLGRRRAIVSEVPGTTRDALESRVELGPWPVLLVDTAGLRDGLSQVEQLGIEVSEEQLRLADVVMACGDSLASVESTERLVTAWHRGPVIRVVTKCDLPREASDPRSEDVAYVSALARTGLEDLLRRLTAEVSRVVGGEKPDAVVVTRARHRAGLERALEELRGFRLAWSGGAVPAVVAAVHLRAACLALDELIGTVSVDDVLSEVFSTFCVGK